jgi:hypothetical protein
MATGRRDSVAAASNQTVVNNIPPPTLSIAALKQNFQNHGLDSRDLVSLSGELSSLLLLLLCESTAAMVEKMDSMCFFLLDRWLIGWLDCI